jgi:hypothetical protein
MVLSNGTKESLKPLTSFKARNIEMLTLSEGSLSRSALIGPLVLVETAKCFSLVMLVNEQDEEQRTKDAELDFFQNAPLPCIGCRMMDCAVGESDGARCLGYTAEEYIGQPIMNFCPDELFLEIFKTLGSGTPFAMCPYAFAPRMGELSTYSSIPTSSITTMRATPDRCYS